MSTVAETFGFTSPSKNNFPLMGLELEAENFDGDYEEDSLDNWNIILDHSLRNSGVEFVHHKPLSGNVLHDSIDELGFYISNYSLSLSHRCSLHVHIDVRALSVEELERFYRLYVLFEPALYHIGAKDRYDNIYCPGMTHATEQVKNAAQAFSVKSFNNLVDYGCKYTGFNFLPMSTQGSIEIRTHAGTLRMDDIHLWVDVLQQMFSYALNHSLEDINKLSSMAPEQAVMAVWDTKLVAYMTCPALYSYWENAKLNLLYMDLIDEALLTYDEVNNHSPNNKDIDIELLNDYVNAHLAELEA